MAIKKYHVSKNLFSESLTNGYTLDGTTGLPSIYGRRCATLNPIDVSGLQNVTISFSATLSRTRVIYSLFDNSTLIRRVTAIFSGTSIDVSDGNKLYICFYDPADTETVTKNDVTKIMLNTGSTPLPYEPYDPEVWHTIPYRKYGTETDTLTTLPAEVIADGNNATVGLVGNMSQTGSPTPQNPIEPSETGERTGNLSPVVSFNLTGVRYYNLTLSTPLIAGTYTISADITPDTGITSARISFRKSDSSQDIGINIPIQTGRSTATVTLSNDCYAIYFYGSESASEIVPIKYDNLMLNEGDTALTYEPYGFKIPILSGGTTTPIYMSEVQSTRQIKKIMLDGTNPFSKGGSGDSGYFVINLGDPTGTMCVCTHFVNTPITASNTDIGASITSSSANLRIRPENVANTTAEQFNQWIVDQYANGTPVTVWYVLATETTGIVNEPIRKIGDYADTVSGITVPTLGTSEQFDVDTTLKPSEVDLTYTGWHNKSDTKF